MQDMPLKGRFSLKISTLAFLKFLPALIVLVTLGSIIYRVSLLQPSKSTVETATFLPVRAETAETPPPPKLASLHMMGNASQVSVVKVKQQNPETRLQLTLAGVFTSTMEDKGSALVSDSRKQSKRYFVGDELPGGALLEAVYSDYIVLSRGGLLENLRFPRSDQSGSRVDQMSTQQSLSKLNYAKDLSNEISDNSRTESIKERLKRLRNNKGS